MLRCLKLKDCLENLQYRPQKYYQAPHEAFPRRSALVEFAGERIAVELVGFVDLHEVVYEDGIHHDGILLMIVEEASALEVGRAYHAAVIVDGHHLGVVEAAVEEEHVDASLGELVAHTLGAFGSERYVTLGRDEYLHVDPTLHGMSQGAAYAGWRQKVGSDNLDLPLGLTDKPEISIENIAIAMARMVVDNGYRRSSSGMTASSQAISWMMLLMTTGSFPILRPRSMKFNENVTNLLSTDGLMGRNARKSCTENS